MPLISEAYHLQRRRNMHQFPLYFPLSEGVTSPVLLSISFLLSQPTFVCVFFLLFLTLQISGGVYIPRLEE